MATLAQSPLTRTALHDDLLDAPPAEPTTPVAGPPRSRARVLLPVLVGLAALAGTGTWAIGRGTETTDDAQVEGHVANVSARVTGQVKHVLVKDNEQVKAGQVLVELDDRDYVVKLAATKADLAAAVATLRNAETQLVLTEKSANTNVIVARGGVTQAAALDGTLHAAIEQAHADIDAAKSRADLARIELDRSASLLARGSIPQSDYDARKATSDQAEAALRQTRSRLVSAEANIGNSAGTIESARGRLMSAELGPDQVAAAAAQVELAKARVDQARAAEDQAELNVTYTQVKAETDGLVSRRTVENGQQVSPDRPLMAIVPLNDTWVVANFKEDQLAHMRSDQSAKITIDSYPGRTFHGRVDSLAAGTGSRFALLPADNASGNFTKVVQRVPVLVRLDEPSDVSLRPGMSAYVSVATN